MASFVTFSPEKNPTPRAVMANIARYLPRLDFISRRVVFHNGSEEAIYAVKDEADRLVYEIS